MPTTAKVTVANKYKRNLYMPSSMKEVWFVTGSQHLYGPKVLNTVADNSAAIVAGTEIHEIHAAD